mmetsp:Transcript_26942/g.22637  ORF Transcript_26942/g.22637 Transcript_26942/m.22637 type:complete len:159 (+) Transcript_26942:824-1300(+)
MLCCLAGLMINFLTAFAWGILTKWLKTWGSEPNWSTLPADATATILFCYGIPKGCFQFISGFIADRVGRRFTIGFGLIVCSISIFAMAFVGYSARDSGSVQTGFTYCALLLGTGTALMYPNVIAAAAEHAEPKNRSMTIGVYRFWRDLGYAVGGLILG